MTAPQAELRTLRAETLQSRLDAPPRIFAPSHESLQTHPWHFADGAAIVCAQMPQELLERIPYTYIDDPDHVELLSYSDLDALFELQGHIRALNPTSRVRLAAPS